MASKPRPTISQSQFDALRPQIRSALHQWWLDESSDFDAAVSGPASGSATASVWEGMPEIDSKAVVKASPIIKQFIGCELDPRLIKKGGYSSFEHLEHDLLSKVRETCRSAPTQRRAANLAI